MFFTQYFQSTYTIYSQSTNMVNYFLRKNTCIQGLHKITGGILKGYEFLENVLWKYRNIFDKNDPSRTISSHCLKCLDPDKWSVQIPIQGHFSAQIVSHYSKRLSIVSNFLTKQTTKIKVKYFFLCKISTSYIQILVALVT